MSTFNLTGYTYSHSINIVATVVEEGTGKLDTPAFIKKRPIERAQDLPSLVFGNESVPSSLSKGNAGFQSVIHYLFPQKFGEEEFVWVFGRKYVQFHVQGGTVLSGILRYTHQVFRSSYVWFPSSGAEANTTQDIYISSEMGSITFEDTKNFYYPNFPFTGKVCWNLSLHPKGA